MSVNYLSLGNFPDQSNIEEQTHQMNYTLRGFTVKNKNKNKMHKTVDNFYNTKHNKIVDELKEIPDQDMKNVDCKCSQIGMFEDKKENLQMKRPYSAHGYKVTNNKLKLSKRNMNINKETLVKAYKENFLASEKDLFMCFNEKKETKIEKPKLIKRTSFNYMKPLNRKLKKKNDDDIKIRPQTAKINNNIVNDEFEDDEEDIDEEKAEKTKETIYGDTKTYKHTNEILSELKESLPKRDLLKLLNNMSKAKEEEIVNTNVNQNVGDVIDEEDEMTRYQKLHDRIKNEIKQKGNFDFTKLTKEEHDLLAKKNIYEKIQKKKEEEKPIVKPKLIKRNIVFKKEKKEEYPNKIIDKNKNKYKDRAKFTSPKCEIINNYIEYIPKPPMNGFMIHSYKKPKVNIINDYHPSKPQKSTIQLKKEDSPIIDNKTITSPLLPENGKI